MITQNRLHELLNYDPSSGEFTWKKYRHGANKTLIAGRLHHRGYRMICVDYKTYLAHRLAWLYVYGHFPKNEIDHINRVKDDNRLCNLREADRFINLKNTKISKNNSSGTKGVSFNKRSKKWHSYISIKGKINHIGFFNNLADATQARKLCEIILGGYL